MPSQAVQGKRKPYSERSLTSSRERTTKGLKTQRRNARKQRASQNKPLQPKVRQNRPRTKETVGVDLYGGHNHPIRRKYFFGMPAGRQQCPEDCPTWISSEDDKK